MSDEIALYQVASRPVPEHSEQGANYSEIQEQKIRSDLDIKKGILEILKKYDIDDVSGATKFAEECDKAGYYILNHLRVASAEKIEQFGCPPVLHDAIVKEVFNGELPE